ncbi:MAG TPA: hypothetical protein V6C69_05040 [Trichormus sp.]
MSIPTDKLQKIRLTVYGVCAANLAAALFYAGLGWFLHSNAAMDEVNKTVPFLWAYFVGFGAIGCLYSIVGIALMLKAVSESERLLRSGKRRETRLVRIAYYPLCKLVFCMVAPKNETAGSAKKTNSTEQEVVFIGVASDGQPFNFNTRTLSDIRNLPAIEATAHSDENGKLRVLTCGNNSLVQVGVIFPPSFVSMVSALYGGK